MRSLYDDLSDALGGEPTREISRRLGVSEAQAQQGMQVALPLIVGALARNAQEPGGERALRRALDRDHDGSVFDDIGGLARGKYEDDGQGILRHALGSRRDVAEQRAAQFAGLDGKTMGKLLALLAPLVMGWLARRKGGGGGEGGGLGLPDILRREEGEARNRGGGGLGDILGDILGGGRGGGGAPRGGAMPGCLKMLGAVLGGKRR